MKRGDQEEEKGTVIHVWDCGSPLYDAHEFVSFVHLIERHMMVVLPSPEEESMRLIKPSAEYISYEEEEEEAVKEEDPKKTKTKTKTLHEMGSTNMSRYVNKSLWEKVMMMMRRGRMNEKAKVLKISGLFGSSCNRVGLGKR